MCMHLMPVKDRTSYSSSTGTDMWVLEEEQPVLLTAEDSLLSELLKKLWLARCFIRYC